METNADALVTENLRLVGLVLRRFKSHIGDDYEDLQQIGYIGLIKAANKFNPEFGTAFSTYAVSMIEGELRQHFRNERPIKIPRSLQDIYYKYCRLKESDKDGDEICRELSISREKLHEAITAMLPLHYIDEPLECQETKKCFVDRIASNDNTEDEVVRKIESKEKFDLLRKCLSGNQIKVLELRLKNKSQAEIAKTINCSQAQVSRILMQIDRIIKKVCNYYEGETSFLMSKGTKSTGLKKEMCENMNESMYESHISAIKAWLIANPNKELRVNRVLKEAGLEIKNGYQSQWTKRAFKQLQEAGYAIEDGKLLGKKTTEQSVTGDKSGVVLTIDTKAYFNQHETNKLIDSHPIKSKTIKLRQMAWLSEDNIRYEVRNNKLVGFEVRTEDIDKQVLSIKTERLQQMIDELTEISKIIGA